MPSQWILPVCLGWERCVLKLEITEAQTQIMVIQPDYHFPHCLTPIKDLLLQFKNWPILVSDCVQAPWRNWTSLPYNGLVVGFFWPHTLPSIFVCVVHGVICRVISSKKKGRRKKKELTIWAAFEINYIREESLLGSNQTERRTKISTTQEVVVLSIIFPWRRRSCPDSTQNDLYFQGHQEATDEVRSKGEGIHQIPI